MIDQAKNICIELLRNIKNPTSTDINNSIDNVLKIFPDLINQREQLFNYLAATFAIFSDNYRILDLEEGYHPWLKDREERYKLLVLEPLQQLFAKENGS